MVETVRSILREDFQLDVPKELVGLDGHMKEIMTWIDNPSMSARMIGIYGMGGIGKTTLAKCIYNRLLNKFGHVSFLPDVRETTKRHSIMYLQRQLILDILKEKNEVSRIDDGINTIKSRFGGKNVLILLDDIDEKNQLDALARERDWFMAGSLIIVTTRNKAILDQSKFMVDFKYELNELDMVQAMLLFNRHAFHTDYSLRDFEGISSDIVATMGGLPLAVKVVGSYLYEKMDRGVWEDVWKKLKNQAYRDIQEILRISYDALEDRHKQIFLDIVCFFIGETREYAMYIWGDYGFYPSQGIEELKLRCLIKIGDDGKFKVHDQLRDLGRSIFCEGQPPDKRSGPWDNDYKGVPKVLRICERASKQLKVLDLSLNWHNLRCTPNLSAFTQLKILMLRSCDKLEHLHRSIGKLTSLVSLNLNRCKRLKKLPKKVGKLTSLVSLDLSSCESLKKLPKEMGKLTSLVSLNLRHCENLKELPEEVVKLTRLVSLDLRFCRSLKELPEEVGELRDLKELLLDVTRITKIPPSIGYLTKLETLSANSCYSLREIPSSIGDLQNLQHLDLQSGIKELPNAIGFLRKLKKLRVACCNSLREIPSSIGDLEDLQHLDLCLSTIEKLPSAIRRLKNLRSLDLSGCKSLKGAIASEIGDLPSLEDLNLSFTLLSDLPESVRNLSSLQHLHLRDCKKLRSLPELPSGLTNLSVTCQSLGLPQLFSLIHLKQLCLDVRHLLEGIHELSPIQLKLCFEGWDKLTSLCLHGLRHLEELSIKKCSSIETLSLSEMFRLK